MYQVISSTLLSLDNTLVITLISKLGKFDSFQDAMCKMTAVMKTYFVWINLLFTVFLTLHFFFYAVFLKDIRRYEVFYIFFSVISPLLFVWVPFTTETYGKVGAFCWIINQKDDGSNHKNGVIEQYTLLYGPCYLFLTVCIILAVIVVLALTCKGCGGPKDKDDREPLVDQKQKHKKAVIELLPLLAYPVIFFCFNLFVIGRRIHDIKGSNPNFQLALAHAFIMTSWGILSSAALLTHIIAMRCIKKSRRHEPDDIHLRTGENRTNKYTKYTEITTYAKTEHFIPEESEVDRNIEET